ncbi:glutamate--putrescine ligase [Congregibacter litoralis KT71]|uniref:Glutamate--putrescine ligase n=1 Tax=Congregibacter litoralis KT71 TaxID=314285 RepID=A4ABK5_9GAMM|nr:glutamate--putrescine ligase [Congregibacter litoralis KT71]
MLSSGLFLQPPLSPAPRVKTVTEQPQAFLDRHPDVELFEVVLADLSGGLRGKWVTRDKIGTVFADELKLPISALVFDSWGRDVEEWVFLRGDGDGCCVPEPRSLAPMPWGKRPMGQILVSLDHEDGTPNPLDPRRILGNVEARLQERGLQPVVASEMEFFLLHSQRDHLGRPRHTQQDSLGGALNTGQTYGLEAMAEVDEFMHAVRECCELQSLAVDTLIKESAPSQYEINLLHHPDALLAADQALLLKRAIRGIARNYERTATFMAKPFGDLAGNGMHLHCSLQDGEGNNLFDDGTRDGSVLLRQAIAGCMETLPDIMLLLAPTLNSYRRFQRGMHAPLAPCWGYENRTVALRVPAGPLSAMRLEHRVGGADAQPHLAIAALLAGMLYGIEQELEPPPAMEGNAWEQLEPSLPRDWNGALDAFRQSRFVADYLGASFQEVYGLVKQQEIDEFSRHVTPLEYDTNF